MIGYKGTSKRSVFSLVNDLLFSIITAMGRKFCGKRGDDSRRCNV